MNLLHNLELKRCCIDDLLKDPKLQRQKQKQEDKCPNSRLLREQAKNGHNLHIDPFSTLEDDRLGLYKSTTANSKIHKETHNLNNQSTVVEATASSDEPLSMD